MQPKRPFCGLGRAGLLALIIAALLVSGVAYAATLTVDDGFVDGAGNFIAGNSIPVLVAQSDGGSSCGVHQGMIALEFGLEGIGATIHSASLTVHVASASLPGTGTLSLVPVSDTGLWSSGSGSLSPGNFDLANPLATVPFTSITAGDELVLNTSQLAEYLNAKRGGVAAVGLVIDTCSAGNPYVYVTSSSGPGPHPTLALLGPTAVTLTTLRASGTRMDWPVVAVAGCFALAAMGAGLRRFRQRRATSL